MQEKIEKMFLVLKAIACETEPTNSHNPEHDTCNWSSVYYEKPLRFNISLREMFSKSGSLRVIKKYDESVLMQTLQEFGTL